MIFKEKQTIIALDIGSKYFRIAIGIQEYSDENNFTIKVIGYSLLSWPENTFVNNEILDQGLFLATIDSAYTDAVRMAGVQCNYDSKIFMSHTCQDILGVTVDGFWPLEPATIIKETAQDRIYHMQNPFASNPISDKREAEYENAIGFADARAAAKKANCNQHGFDISYWIDDQQVSFEEMLSTAKGETLKLKRHYILMDSENTHNLSVLISRFFTVQDLNHNYFSGLTSAAFVCSDKEIEDGVLSIDIGMYSTNYVVLKNNSVLYSGQINAGIKHVANDLLVAFEINNIEEAEILLENFANYGSLGNEDDGQARVINSEPLPDVDLNKTTFGSDVDKVIGARIQEIFELIYEVVNENNDNAYSSIKIAGPANKIPGINIVAQNILGKTSYTNCDIPEKLIFANKEIEHSICNSEWASTLGIFAYFIRINNDGLTYKSKPISLIIKIFNLIKASICKIIPSSQS